jgi:proliferating cell nuclear antigen
MSSQDETMTDGAGSSVPGETSSYLLEIKTMQATTFKQVIDALKEILMDVNLEFDETGMKIVAMDNTHVVLVHLKLDADRFETYTCEKKLYVGINMLKLHMLIKTISNNDVLTLFVERDDPNMLGIRIENPDKNVRTNYKLSMFDINVLNINIPPADFPTVITMPSVDFQKVVRDMHNLADFIEIRNVEKQLCFSCKGDFCTQETILGVDKNQGLSIVKNGSNKSHEIIQGVFSLKYLSMFTKCTNLCNVVEIFLKNNFPLVLRYSVASLGEAKFVLAQSDENM